MTTPLQTIWVHWGESRAFLDAWAAKPKQPELHVGFDGHAFSLSGVPIHESIGIPSGHYSLQHVGDEIPRPPHRWRAEP